MSENLKEYYNKLTVGELKQKVIELKEFMKKIFYDNTQSEEFKIVLARYEYIEDLLRMRGA